MNEENSFWKGSSSQWLNLGPFTGSLLMAAGLVIGGLIVPLALPFALIALVLPVGYMIWKYLVVRTRVYEITSQRVRVTSGVINQTIDEIELYRVKDTQMFRPWWMRLTGLASIQLETSDRSIPSLVIPAVRGGAELREILREQVELTRDRKRVREMDFEEGGGPLADA
ncbi:MAG: PH domain-containing protein [Verrucomicrobiota bacterium]